MLLAIDIGNTNTVFAVYDGDAQKGAWRLRSGDQHSGDEYATFLKPLLDHARLSFDMISAVYVGSVMPKAQRGITQFCRKYTKADPVFMTADHCGIEVDLPKPQSVGIDRLLNAVTILAEGQKTPAVVIDFGTATTFDVIDGQGRYSGGVIAPGINLSMEALAAAAAKLPLVDVRPTEKVIAKSTEEAMQAGLFWGYAGLIEGILTRMTAELGAAPRVIATGGLAPLFAEHIERIEAVDSDLTLRGLVHVYKKDKE